MAFLSPEPNEGVLFRHIAKLESKPKDIDLVSDPRTSRRTLKKLIYKNLPDSEMSDYSVFEEKEFFNQLVTKIIMHPNISDKLLFLFYSMNSEISWAILPEVKVLAARRHSKFPFTFSALAGSLDSEVRAAIASHPDTPSFLLTQLSADADPTVRATTAANSNLNIILLNYLASRDDNEVVREIAIENLGKRN